MPQHFLTFLTIWSKKCQINSLLKICYQPCSKIISRPEVFESKISFKIHLKIIFNRLWGSKNFLFFFFTDFLCNEFATLFFFTKILKEKPKNKIIKYFLLWWLKNPWHLKSTRSPKKQNFCRELFFPRHYKVLISSDEKILPKFIPIKHLFINYIFFIHDFL